MRAGKLDLTITVKRETETVDSYGTPGISRSTVASLRAQRLTATVSEFLSGAGTATTDNNVFRTRFVDDVKTRDVVEFDGSIHDIVEVKTIDRGRGLEIRTVRRATQ